MRRLLILWAALILLWTACPALAEEDDLPTLTDEELLDMMAEAPEAARRTTPPSWCCRRTSIWADEDVFTVLLIGTDAYTDDHRGRSDSVILVSVNAETKRVRMSPSCGSVRKIPGKGSNRLNASYIWGGEEAAAQTLEQICSVTADGVCGGQL